MELITISETVKDPAWVWSDDMPFAAPEKEDTVWIELITNGTAVVNLNGDHVSITAPIVLTISESDRIELEESKKLEGVRFGFSPHFLNGIFTIERLKLNDFHSTSDLHSRNLMEVFLKRDEYFDGIIDLLPQAYLRIMEWISSMNEEIAAPTDSYWSCRIHRDLLQILFVLEDIYRNRQKPSTARNEKSPVDIALEYIHTHYANAISLESLCRLVHLNRTSLNRKFKEKTGQTPMDYLRSHRVKVACEILTRTGLSLNEIAESLGYKYESHFIKQFTSKMGISPTEYRNSIKS